MNIKTVEIQRLLHKKLEDFEKYIYFKLKKTVITSKHFLNFQIMHVLGKPTFMGDYGWLDEKEEIMLYSELNPFKIEPNILKNKNNILYYVILKDGIPDNFEVKLKAGFNTWKENYTQVSNVRENGITHTQISKTNIKIVKLTDTMIGFIMNSPKVTTQPTHREYRKWERIVYKPKKYTW